MTAARRVVAVVAEPGTTEPLRALVAALCATVEVRAASRVEAPDAVLAASPGAATRAPTGVPVAVLRDGRLHVEGHEPIDLPAGPTVATRAWPPVPPLVRRRWRERLGLPDDLVVDVTTLAPDDRPTALAVAAAAVVGPEDLPLAFALGCPVADGLDEARAVAADEPRAARLSREGRAHAVGALDPERAVERLLAAWGIGSDLGPVAACAARLSELGTAPAAPIRRRVADALALFGGT